MDRLIHLFAAYIRRDLNYAEEIELTGYISTEPLKTAFTLLLVHLDEFYDDEEASMAIAIHVLTLAGYSDDQ